MKLRRSPPPVAHCGIAGDAATFVFWSCAVHAGAMFRARRHLYAVLERREHSITLSAAIAADDQPDGFPRNVAKSLETRNTS